MKTLEQIAEAAGVTKAAIYKRFQSYGLSVTNLKGEKQGRATVYGEEVENLILLIFQPKNDVRAVENNGKRSEAKSEDLQGIEACEVVESSVESLDQKKARTFNCNGSVESSVENSVTVQRERIQELQGLAANLEVETKAANELKVRAEARAVAAEEKAAAETARAERAEAQIEVLLQQVDKLTDAIKAAEAIQAAQIARLPTSPPEREKGGLFGRLRNRIKGGNKK